MSMIEVSGLCKRYGSVRAIDGLSFELDGGVVMGVLGPNGAGKTTTLRVLAGFIGFDGGRVRIGGHDIRSARRQALALIGYMPEGAPMYPEMRVAEYLRFRCELKGVARRGRRSEVERVLRATAATDMAEVAIGHLSKGYRQRVGLADAILGAPRVLILDEPGAGLDPNQIRQLRTLVRDLAEDHTVLLSTHILSEVEATCDQVLVIDRGRTVAAGMLAEVTERFGRGMVHLVVGSEANAAPALLRGLDSVCDVELSDGPAAGTTTLLVRLTSAAADDSGRATEALVQALSAAGVGVRAVGEGNPSLERVFARLTEVSAAEQDTAPPAWGDGEP